VPFFAEVDLLATPKIVPKSSNPHVELIARFCHVENESGGLATAVFVVENVLAEC